MRSSIPPAATSPGACWSCSATSATIPAARGCARAVQFIRKTQEDDGSWYGRWGVNYIYGTWQVLRGLRAIGVDMHQPWIVRARDWLESCQNEDGGWGETCASYDDPDAEGQRPEHRQPDGVGAHGDHRRDLAGRNAGAASANRSRAASATSGHADRPMAPGPSRTPPAPASRGSSISATTCTGITGRCWRWRRTGAIATAPTISRAGTSASRRGAGWSAAVLSRAERSSAPLSPGPRYAGPHMHTVSQRRATRASEAEVAPMQHVDLDGAWPRGSARRGDLPRCPRLGAAAALQRDAARDAGVLRVHGSSIRRASRFSARAISITSPRCGWRGCASRTRSLSFDNHPDWDIRPPRWCCGTWVSRALESPLLRRAAIWGCGNFELDRPNSFFANHRGSAERAARRPPVGRAAEAGHAAALARARRRATWRAEFAAFARGARRRGGVHHGGSRLPGRGRSGHELGAAGSSRRRTWRGRSSEVRDSATVVGGDLCGAWSEPEYARFRQRIEGRLDHPKHAPIDPEAARGSAICARGGRSGRRSPARAGA